MKRKILLLSLILLLVTSPAWAGFVNGGFESADFSGWIKNGGSFDGVYHYTGDPAKSTIVTSTSGSDPIVGINMVYSGNYSARINDGDSYYTGWGDYHFSTITQSVVWNDPNIYFAWAAVLEEPGHPHAYEPNFSVKLTDLTKGVVLYDMFFASDTIPPGLLHMVGDWKYTDWQVVNLDTSGVMGDTLELTLLASDCGYGGHSGYAYLDGFGAAPPPPGPVPVPTTFLLLGSGLAGLLGYARMRFNK